MRVDQAKTIPVSQYLAAEGYKPVRTRQQGRELWYQSPIRQGERTASFKVDTVLNCWFDHGAGKGGNTLDLVVELHRATVRDALRILERTGLYDEALFRSKVKSQSYTNRKPSGSQTRFSPIGDVLEEKKKALEARKQDQAAQTPDRSFKLLREGPIRHPALLEYLAARKIDKAVAQKYLREVRFTAPETDREFFALGWPTLNPEIWEVRNSKFKGIVGTTKTISHLKTIGASKCVVFEGFFDFLAFMTHNKYRTCPCGVIVLNSAALKSRAAAAILEMGYKEIDLYLDNDATGSDTTAYFQNLLGALTVTDCRRQYADCKDFNELLMKGAV